MSRWELEQVLAKREVDERTATAELDRLESIGLIDDAIAVFRDAQSADPIT